MGEYDNYSIKKKITFNFKLIKKAFIYPCFHLFTLNVG